MSSKKIAVDLDGTVVKFNEAFASQFNIDNPEALIEEWTINSYDMATPYDITDNKLADAFDSFTTNNCWEFLPTYSAWEKLVKRLHKEGHELHLITARSTHHGSPEQKQDVRRQTMDSVEEIFGLEIFQSISFERDKVALCDFLGIDFLLDDAPRYAKTALETNANVTVIVPNRAWNQDVEHMRADEAYRVITGKALDKKSYYNSKEERQYYRKK